MSLEIPLETRFHISILSSWKSHSFQIQKSFLSSWGRSRSETRRPGRVKKDSSIIWNAELVGSRERVRVLCLHWVHGCAFCGSCPEPQHGGWDLPKKADPWRRTCGHSPRRFWWSVSACPAAGLKRFGNPWIFLRGSFQALLGTGNSACLGKLVLHSHSERNSSGAFLQLGRKIKLCWLLQGPCPC